MPSPNNLSSQEVLFNGPYYPSLPSTAPGALVGTIRRGSNVWRDPGGKIRVANGLLEMSSTNVGARLFAADIQRASIEGALIGSRLPFAGLLRYENAVLLYLSEETDAQVWLDEVAISGLTTSSTAGRLRVAVPDGVGGYDVYDAGFDKPVIGPGTPTAQTADPVGAKPMISPFGVAVARWRSVTNAIGPPSEVVRLEPPHTGTIKVEFDLTLLDTVPGQDGWIFAGTRWNDESGELRVVRYVYLQPRGTFTATNGSTQLTAGVDTFWTLDLRPGDGIRIDGDFHTITEITSDGEATLNTPFGGTGGSGKTMTIQLMDASWYDSELGDLLQRDIIKPPAGAGVIQYAGRVLVWGCFGGSGNPTGPVIFPLLDENPEHSFIRGIRTDSGADLVNVLGADGPLYLMTTQGLEIVTLTGDPNKPYDVKQIASPGFKSPTNGILFGDYFYGFNKRPFRTQASKNLDFRFAAPVKSDMEGWEPARVTILGDPVNQAVLYVYDDTTQTKVVPFMAEQEQWNPPIYFTGRFLDGAVVDGTLYVTVLDGANIRVNAWEGGTGIGGTRFISSQYYDPNYLKSNRLKPLTVVGKAGSVSVYAVTPDAEPPDVGNLGAAAVTFTLSDTSKKEPEIRTNVAGDAYALRVDFTSNDGYLDKIVVGGLPRGESR